ncbi:MAG: hypothetical protein QOG23_3740 [Blastocatellia bacterium]|jgi:hypothetical protein|nr:hypothetical protein [Blastocatellia bacterium]
MRKHSLRFLFFLVILLAANFAVPSGASGQQQRYYPPYELYQFYMNGTNGYWYAPWYSIGVNAGYTYQGPFGSGPNGCCYTAGIYPRVDEGYTPAPSTGLVPLYQWTVFQGARSYTYLSTYYASHGSGYYFNGVSGYVYPASTNYSGTTIMAQWYSQSRGFWYGRNEPGNPAYFEFPPDGTYAYQGIVCKLPPPSSATAPGRCEFGGGISLPRCDGSFAVPYDPPPPPPPPPTCDPNDEQWCYNSGGWWDSSSCTCNWSQR